MSSAFGQRESSGIWVGVAGGKITRKAEADDRGAVKVLKVDKKGEPVLAEDGSKQYYYRFEYDNLTGRIISLRKSEDKWGDVVIPVLIVTLWHPTEGKINLKIKTGNRYWMGLMNVLLNVDVTKEVTFLPYDYKSKKDGKQKTGMGLKQEGKDIPWKWTKDSTDGPPKLDYVRMQDGEIYEVNGKPVWNWKPVHDWLTSNVLEKVQARVVDAVAMVPIAGVQIEEPEEHQDAPEPAADPMTEAFAGGVTDEDDLPF